MLSLFLGSQRDAARIAAERRRVCSTALAAIGRYFLPTGLSAANPPAAVAVVNRRYSETDGRTDGRPTIT